MARTKSETIRIVTEEYLATDIGKDPQTTPADVQGDILDQLKSAFDLENTVKAKNEKWQVPDRLLPIQVATILVQRHPIVMIETAGKNSDKEYLLLGLYQEDGPDEGLYSISDESIENLADTYQYGMSEREVKEMIRHLRRMAPRKELCRDKNLIAVNNGIFDFDTKQLLSFDKQYVFTAKSRVNYNPNARNVVIHNPMDNTDWDVESWMNDLSDDKDVVNLLWQILGAIIRPNVPWGQAAWLYSESGNNGKGTLCELMRELCGKTSYASIPLSDMGKDFMLEPLIRATAIIVDENDVGTYIDKAANLKAIVTGDTVSINRKFKQAISYQFKGFVVQCLNEMPRVKDKSDSFARRQLFIPFTKCFTGAERKYIKHDYMHRPDVLEYVLYRVLNMKNYYQLDTPDVCVKALAEYREFNDPVRQFVEEILPQCLWDLLPFTFLYDLYRAWFQKYIPSGSPQARNTFIKDLLIAIQGNFMWQCPDKNAKIKTGKRITCAEPLIEEYNLTNWYNKKAMGSSDINKRCFPNNLATSYRGLTRIPGYYTTQDEELEENQDTE